MVRKELILKFLIPLVAAIFVFGVLSYSQDEKCHSGNPGHRNVVSQNTDSAVK